MSLWFYYDENGKQGPIQPSELKTLAEMGQITPDTIVETEAGRKAKASAVKGLFQTVQNNINKPTVISQPKQINLPQVSPIMEDQTHQFLESLQQSASPNKGNNLWYYYDNGSKIGPFPIGTLVKMARSGIIERKTLLEDSNENQLFAEDMEHIFNFNSMDNSSQNGINWSSQQQSQQPIHISVNDPYPYRGDPKSRITAVLLSFFLGGFGIHKFYLGDNGAGVLYIILTLSFIGLPIVAILNLIDFITLLLMSDSLFHKKYG